MGSDRRVPDIRIFEVFNEATLPLKGISRHQSKINSVSNILHKAVRQTFVSVALLNHIFATILGMACCVAKECASVVSCFIVVDNECYGVVRLTVIRMVM